MWLVLQWVEGTGYEGNRSLGWDHGNTRVFLEEASSASCLPKFFLCFFSSFSSFLVSELIQCFQTLVAVLFPLNVFPRKVNIYSPGVRCVAWVSVQE